MVEEGADLMDFRCSCSEFGLRAGDVFTVLTTSGIRTVSRSNEGQRAADTMFLHLTESVCEHRMPVAISPIDWKVRTVLCQFRLQRGDQLASLLVDGAFSVEVIVVFGDGEHALAGNISPAKDIFEERNNIFPRLRTAEGDN